MTDALKPLTDLARKYPNIEGEVIWADGSDWAAQEDEADGLDGEEIPYHAEAMIAEGYGCAWQVLGETVPEFVRLFFWQGTMPDLPDDPDVLSSAIIGP